MRKLLGNSSALRKESALQELISKKEISAYVGLSISKLAELLHVGSSQADRIKRELEQSGYIKCNKKYNTVLTTNAPDMSLYSHLPSNRRYSLKVKRTGGSEVYEYSERSYDEIINCMEFTNQRSIIRRLKYENKHKIDLMDQKQNSSMPFLPYNPPL